VNEYVTNIMDTYLRLTEAEIEEGMHWYDNTRALATEWANGDVWKGAGVIAAYSPATDWPRNLELAKSSLELGFARTDALGMNALKAQRILDGEPVLPVLNGPKTTAFASAIADPDSDLVTIDSHAYSIAVGYWVPTSGVPHLRKRRYASFADAYTEAAGLAGYHVSQFQAMTWVGWKNRHPKSEYRSRKRG